MQEGGLRPPLLLSLHGLTGLPFAARGSAAILKFTHGYWPRASRSNHVSNPPQAIAIGTAILKATITARRVSVAGPRTDRKTSVSSFGLFVGKVGRDVEGRGDEGGCGPGTRA